MTWTRPIYLNYDDRKYDRLFSIGIKNGINISINIHI